MNRQQRRLLARRNAVKAGIERELIEHQQGVSDITILTYMVCIGLAINEVCGDDKDDLIVPVIQEFNRQITRVDGTKVTYETLKQEFEEKTGHQLVWV